MAETQFDNLEIIDLSEWTLMRAKTSSKNYVSPDEKWFIKLFFPFNDEQYDQLYSEQQRALNVLSLGVKTPKVGNIVRTTDGYFGLVFENIVGKRSISRAISEDPENYKHYLQLYKQALDELHAIPCDPNVFSNVFAEIDDIIDEFDDISDFEAQRLREFIRTLPQETTCVHMDGHPANIIINPEEEAFLIDLGAFGYGPAILDEALLYFFMKATTEESSMRMMRFAGPLRDDVWNYWVTECKGITDPDERAAYEDHCLACSLIANVLHFRDVPFTHEHFARNKQICGIFK